MTHIAQSALLTILAAPLLSRQKPAAENVPFEARSLSTVALTMKDTQAAVAITNVTYELTGDGIPGRPRAERLLLRTTSRTNATVGEIGKEVSTTVQAWPLGIDPSKKPLYTLIVQGLKPAIINHLIVITRGVEEGVGGRSPV